MEKTVRALKTVWSFVTEDGKVKAFNDLVTQSKVEVERVTAALRPLQQGLMKVAKYASVAGAAIMASIVYPAVKAEEAMRKAMVATGATGKEYKKLYDGLSKQARELSVKYGMSVEEISGGMFQALSNGAQGLTKDFDALLETGIKFTKLVGGDTGANIDMLIDTAEFFKIEMKDIGSFADKLFRSAQLGKTSVQDMLSAIQEVAPIASSTNQTFDDTITAMTLFAEAGIKGANAGNAYRLMLLNLQDANNEAMKWLEKQGVHVFDLHKNLKPIPDILQEIQGKLRGMSGQSRSEIISTLVGNRAYAGVSAVLAKDIAGLGQYRAGIAAAGGSMQAALDERTQSPLEKFNRLKQQFYGTLRDIGIDILPSLNEALKTLGDLLVNNKAEIKSWGDAFVNAVRSMTTFVRDTLPAIKELVKWFAALWAVNKVNSWRMEILKAAKGAGDLNKAFSALILTKGPLLVIAYSLEKIASAIWSGYQAAKAWNEYHDRQKQRDETNTANRDKLDAMKRYETELRSAYGKDFDDNTIREAARMMVFNKEAVVERAKRGDIQAETTVNGLPTFTPTYRDAEHLAALSLAGERMAGLQASKRRAELLEELNRPDLKAGRRQAIQREINELEQIMGVQATAWEAKGVNAGISFAKGVKEGAKKEFDKWGFLHPGFDAQTQAMFKAFARSMFGHQASWTPANQYGAYLSGRNIQEAGGPTSINMPITINGVGQNARQIVDELTRRANQSLGNLRPGVGGFINWSIGMMPKQMVPL